MIDIDLVSNYKKCKEKQHEVWACKPPKGTVIINKLEQKDVLDYLSRYIKNLQSKCFLTPRELEHIRCNKSELYSDIIRYCYITNEETSIVLAGTALEMWVTSFNNLRKNYDMSQSNGWVPLESGIRTKIKNMGGESIFDWCKLRTKTTEKDSMAMFVPKSQQGYIVTSCGQSIGYNLSGIPHGNGDFIVCSSEGGRPNLGDRTVVNGLVFANTYDNRGWSRYLDNGNVELGKPRPLYKSGKKVALESADTIKNILDSIQSTLRNIDSSNSDEYYESVIEYIKRQDFKRTASASELGGVNLKSVNKLLKSVYYIKEGSDAYCIESQHWLGEYNGMITLSMFWEFCAKETERKIRLVVNFQKEIISVMPKDDGGKYDISAKDMNKEVIKKFVTDLLKN